MPTKPGQIQVIILAAGDGKRMKSSLPKVMTLLRGRPLIDHVATNVEAAGFMKPVVVVSKKNTLVQEYLKDRAEYVIQEEQLGTGHAVAATEPYVRGRADHIVVLYGDMPFLQPRSIRRLVESHLSHHATLSMLTATTPDFDSWRGVFKTFGRVVRDREGHIQKIVEAKDATPDELTMRELSTSDFCFEANWLWDHVPRLEKNNAQKEYYLVDLLAMAIREGVKIALPSIPVEEVVGVNTRDDIVLAEQL